MREFTKADAIEISRRLLQDAIYSIEDHVMDYVDEQLGDAGWGLGPGDLEAIDGPLVAEVEGVLTGLIAKVKNWEV